MWRKTRMTTPSGMAAMAQKIQEGKGMQLQGEKEAQPALASQAAQVAQARQYPYTKQPSRPWQGPAAASP